MENNKAIRPTKKQKELLAFIAQFIGEHGYSPSYREIMSGLQYTSVATVALHVNNLIKRGHLRKRDRSARSLEVVDQPDIKSSPAEVSEGQEKWLMQRIQARFDTAEQSENLDQKEIDQLYVLVGALKVLGFDEAANSFIPRLSAIKKDTQTT